MEVTSLKLTNVTKVFPRKGRMQNGERSITRPSARGPASLSASSDRPDAESPLCSTF